MKFVTKFYIKNFLILLYVLVSPRIFASITPKTKPWYRLEGHTINLKINKSNTHLAYTDQHGMNLRVLELESGKIFQITTHKVGPSFLWSPNGFRLFYRELIRTNKNGIKSSINAFDLSQMKSHTIKTVPSSSGFLSFDPRDFRLHLLYPKGILNHKIVYPNERLAKWQIAQRTEDGKWIATNKGVLWLTQLGFSMQMMKDDKSGVQSFDISPDGRAICWATKRGNIYFSISGKSTHRLGAGQDPTWHPQKKGVLIYAAARKIGNKVINYDLRLTDITGAGRYITTTQYSSERWPRWLKNGKGLVYTLDNTTDIYKVELKE